MRNVGEINTHSLYHSLPKHYPIWRLNYAEWIQRKMLFVCVCIWFAVLLWNFRFSVSRLFGCALCLLHKYRPMHLLHYPGQLRFTTNRTVFYSLYTNCIDWHIIKCFSS